MSCRKFLQLLLKECLGFRKNFDEGIEEGSFELTHLGGTEYCARIKYPDDVLAYVPDSPFIRSLVEQVACGIGYNKAKIQSGLSDSFTFGLEFSEIEVTDEEVPDTLKYIIYPNEGTYSYDAWYRFDDIGNIYVNYSEENNDSRISLSKIFELQIYIDRFFLKAKMARRNRPDITMVPMNRFLWRDTARSSWVSFFALTFIIFGGPTNVFMARLIVERRTGFTDYLKARGFSTRLQRAATVSAGFIDYIISVASLATFYHLFQLTLSEYDAGPHEPYIQANIPTKWFFLFLLPWLSSILCFSYFWSFFFKSILVYLLFFIATWFSPLFYVMLLPVLEFSRYAQIILCLLPAMSIFQALHLISSFDFYGRSPGLSEKLYPIPNVLRLLDVAMMTGFVALFYAILLISFDVFRLHKYDEKGHFYFMLPGRKGKKKVIGTEEARPNTDLIDKPPDKKIEISIQHLTKIYQTNNRGDILALDDISIDFFEGEITGVVGHEKAGKSTLLSILGGVSAPSFGKVYIDGKEAVGNTGVLSNVEYCGAYGILGPSIIVGYNLYFHKIIKSDSKTPEESKRICIEIINHIKQKKGLAYSRNRCFLPHHLYPGEYKILSLAAALYGDPKILILDEITTELNPEEKKVIREILLKLRGIKTIILTTRVMEEAESICDRIVVLDHGKVKCYGPPKFLQSQFPLEYILCITVADSSKVNSVSDAVKKLVKPTSFQNPNGLILEFKFSSSESANLGDLFESMENKQREGEILSYHVSVPRLGDKLLSGNDTAVEEFTKLKETTFPDDGNGEGPEKKLNWILLCLNQIGALFSKKLIYLRRNYIILIFCIILSIVLHALFDYLPMISLKIPYHEIDSLPFTLDSYGETEILYSYSYKDDMVEAFENEVSYSEFSLRKVDDVIQALTESYETDLGEHYKQIFAVEFKRDKIEIFYNSRAKFAPGIAINIMDNALLSLKNSWVETSISLKYFEEELSGKISSCPKLAFSIPFRLIIEPWIFAIGIRNELKHNLKTLQLMSTSATLYWLTHILFDLPLLYIYSLISHVFNALGDEALADFMQDHKGRLSLGLFFTSACTLVLIYATITLTNSLCFSLFVVFALLLITVIFFSTGYLDLFQDFKYLTPNGLWLNDIIAICHDSSENLWTFYQPFLIYLLILFALLILIDSGTGKKICHKFWSFIFCIKFLQKYDKDPSVEIEKEIVRKAVKKQLPQPDAPILILKNLKRWLCVCNYDKWSCCARWSANHVICACMFPSIKGISIAVNKGECLGVIGSPTSGKSEICRILSGSIYPSYGTAYLNNISLSNCFRHRRTFYEMGYCPQSGGLFLSFQGRETLEFFARLKGFRGFLLRKEVDKWIKWINLEDQDKKCKFYPLGMQRKLSVAIAFMGHPKLVVLDQPTAGIDPLSCQTIWKCINYAKEQKQTVLLTSESIGECETMSNRSAVIIRGELIAIVPTEILKAASQEVYHVVLKITASGDFEDITSLKTSMYHAFGDDSSILAENFMILEYVIKKEKFAWKKVFLEMNLIKSKFTFLEYFTISFLYLERAFTRYDFVENKCLICCRNCWYKPVC